MSRISRIGTGTMIVVMVAALSVPNAAANPLDDYLQCSGYFLLDGPLERIDGIVLVAVDRDTGEYLFFGAATSQGTCRDWIPPSRGREIHTNFLTLGGWESVQKHCEDDLPCPWS